jgi:hypothetical protein
VKRNANWQKYLTLSPRKYAGKYVVIADGKLIGSGRDLTKLVARARRLCPQEVPLVARMRDPRKLCVY